MVTKKGYVSTDGMEIKLEINKRRPESLEELGVYMQGIEEGAKAAAKVLVELLAGRERRRKRKNIK